ncbi:protein SRC2-like [Fagus crenata]
MANSDEMPTPIRFYTFIKSAEDLAFCHPVHQNLILGSDSGLYVDVFILDENDDSLPTHKKTPIVGVAINPKWNHPMGFIIEFGDADQGFLTLVAQIRAKVKEVDDILIAEVRLNIKELVDKDPDNSDGEKHLSFVVTSPSGVVKGLLNFCFKFSELIFPLSHAVPAAEAAAPVAGHGGSTTSSAAYPPPGSFHLYSPAVTGGYPIWSHVAPPYQYPEQQSSIVGRLARRLAARVGFEFLAHEVLNWTPSGDDFGFGDGLL